MKCSETDIEMVRRHIHEGEVTLARQRITLARLSEKGLPTESAYELLRLFEHLQSEHRAHLDRLQISN
jgi:predicted transcriptional regulator